MWKDWGQVKLNRERISQLTIENTELEDYSGILTKRLIWLDRQGYLEPGTFISDGGCQPKLSTLGLAATEVNEACPLILPAFYLRDTDMRAELIKNPANLVCVLSCFLETYWKGEDGTAPDPAWVVRDACVPDIVKQSFQILDGLSKKLVDLEGVQERSTRLSGDWMELLWRWLEGGEDPSALCATYELFEGNFVRGVMKLGNILDEWLAIATLFGHTEQVEAVSQIRPLLVRDFVFSDSLYLRLN